MPPVRIERVERQVLLSERDREHAEVIIRIGLAENVSQAIRVGLAYTANWATARATATTP